MSSAGQLQVATALSMLTALEAHLEALRRELIKVARHLRGARVLTARLYGVGPITALALTCWLGGAGRFSSAGKAVRFAGLDVTVHSSDGKRSPGQLSRQGPEVCFLSRTPTSSASERPRQGRLRRRSAGTPRALRTP